MTKIGHPYLLRLKKKIRRKNGIKTGNYEKPIKQMNKKLTYVKKNLFYFLNVHLFPFSKI